MLDANADDACVGVIAWMHTFSPGEDVDQRPRRAAQAAAAPAHAGQRRAAVGDHRHGLHEPEPGRPRRPGVRVHRRPGSACARKTVAGHVSDPDGRPDRRRGPGRRAGVPTLRRLRLARFGDNMRDVAVTEGDKVEAELRFGVSVNTYGVNDLVEVVDAVADSRRRRPRRGVRRRVRRRRRSCARRRPARSRCATAPASRPGLRAFLADGRLRGVHHELRGPRRAAAAARSRRAAADGRRLRLRRRGRLEDLGAAAHAEGRWPTGCPAGRPSWRTTPTTSAPASRADPRRAHARGVPVDRGRPAVAARSTRWASAAARTRSGWCSTPRRARRRRRHLPTSATASGSSPTRSTSSRPSEPLPKLPVARAVWQPAPDLRPRPSRWLHRRRAAPHRALHRASTAEHARRPRRR